MDSPGLLVLPTVDSTNTYAKNHFSELADGLVVCAEEQTAGRGRLGRQWVTQTGTALCATAVFKRLQMPFHAGCITGLAGLALVRECVPDEFIFFKWPNDIYVDDRKLSGILSEGILEHNRLAGVVSGIGINVNQDDAMLAALPARATSLFSLGKRNFCLKTLQFRLAELVNLYYIMYLNTPDKILALWREENRLIGEKLTVVTPSGEIRTGCFRAIDGEGRMLLSDGGKLFTFDCGDVKIDASQINFQALAYKHKTNGGKNER